VHGAGAVGLALALTACGRFDFDPLARAPGGGDDASGQDDGSGPGGDGAVTPISYVTGWGNVTMTPGKTDSITVQASAAGNAIVMIVGCAGSALPTAVQVSAPGWTFTQLEPIGGTTNGPWGALYGAIAPDTAMATVTVSWTVTNCQVGVAEIADEFASAAGTMTFDAHSAVGGMGDCSGQVTTASANEAIWAACLSGGITAFGPSYTQAEMLGNREWSEYKLTTDPTATQETATFISTGPNYIATAAIRAR
jgi:hypothetical protein